MTGEPFPAPPGRPPDVDDAFDGATLRGDLWVDHYLPHWTTPDRSAARYDLLAPGLRLRIDADQPDWRPEDAPLRVSNLQTGLAAARVGTTQGMHRHRPDGLAVRTATPERLLWAPAAARVDVTVTASRDPGTMLAIWLVGAEQAGQRQSGEICVAEIDAAAVGPPVRARSGIKAHADPDLTTDMAEVEARLHAGRPHTWSVQWSAGQTLLGCEGRVLRRLHQAPAYPVLLMVDLFETAAPAGSYPKAAVVHRVRGWEL